MVNYTRVRCDSIVISEWNVMFKFTRVSSATLNRFGTLAQHDFSIYGSDPSQYSVGKEYEITLALAEPIKSEDSPTASVSTVAPTS